MILMSLQRHWNNVSVRHRLGRITHNTFTLTEARSIQPWWKCGQWRRGKKEIHIWLHIILHFEQFYFFLYFISSAIRRFACNYAMHCTAVIAQISILKRCAEIWPYFSICGLTRCGSLRFPFIFTPIYLRQLSLFIVRAGEWLHWLYLYITRF